MYTYTIIKSETVQSIANESYSTEVTIDIFKDTDIFDRKKFGYKLGTTKDEILADLDNVMKTLESDEINSLKSAELDKVLTEAELLNQSLLNK